MKRKFVANGGNSSQLPQPDANGMVNLPGIGLVALPSPSGDGLSDDEGVIRKKSSGSASGSAAKPRARAVKSPESGKKKPVSASKSTSGKKATSARKRKDPNGDKPVSGRKSSSLMPSIPTSNRPRRATKKKVLSDSDYGSEESDEDMEAQEASVAAEELEEGEEPDDEYTERKSDEKKDSISRNHRRLSLSAAAIAAAAAAAAKITAMEHDDEEGSTTSSDDEDDQQVGAFAGSNKGLSQTGLPAGVVVPATPAHQRSNHGGRNSTNPMLQTPVDRSILSTPHRNTHSRASSQSSGSNKVSGAGNGLQLSSAYPGLDSTPLRAKMSSPTMAMSLSSPSARELLSPAISAQLFSPPHQAALQRMRPVSTPLTHTQRYHNMLVSHQRTPGGLMPPSPSHAHMLSVPNMAGGMNSAALGPPQTPSRVLSMLASPSAFISTPSAAAAAAAGNHHEDASNGAGAHAASNGSSQEDEDGAPSKKQKLVHGSPAAVAAPFININLSARPLPITPLLRYNAMAAAAGTPTLTSASSMHSSSLSMSSAGTSPAFDTFFQASPMRASRRGKRGLEFHQEVLGTPTPASARTDASADSPLTLAVPNSAVSSHSGSSAAHSSFFGSPQPVRDHLHPTAMTDVPSALIGGVNGSAGLGMGKASVNALLSHLKSQAESLQSATVAASAAAATGHTIPITGTLSPSTPLVSSSASPLVLTGASSTTVTPESASGPAHRVGLHAASLRAESIPLFDREAIESEAIMPPADPHAKVALLSTPSSKKSLRNTRQRAENAMGSPLLAFANMLP